MELYESAKLRMQCLELAKSVAISSSSGLYGESLISEATKYWNFVESISEAASTKSDDDIPF